MKPLARILHEAFYYERRKHGIFGSILEVRTRMYSSTIRPQTSRINFALWARTFRTSTALATKFRAICGLVRYHIADFAINSRQLWDSHFPRVAGIQLPQALFITLNSGQIGDSGLPAIDKSNGQRLSHQTS